MKDEELPDEHPDNRDVRLAEAIAEYSDLEADGQEVELTEFCGRYPELAPDLRACLQSLAPLGAGSGATADLPPD